MCVLCVREISWLNVVHFLCYGLAKALCCGDDIVLASLSLNFFSLHGSIVSFNVFSRVVTLFSYDDF